MKLCVNLGRKLADMQQVSCEKLLAVLSHSATKTVLLAFHTFLFSMNKAVVIGSVSDANVYGITTQSKVPTGDPLMQSSVPSALS